MSSLDIYQKRISISFLHIYTLGGGFNAEPHGIRDYLEREKERERGRIRYEIQGKALRQVCKPIFFIFF